MKKICIFCGSAKGNRPEYVEHAKSFGAWLAKSNRGLVYGGASIGVMGALADGCLDEKGKVWGVIPKSLMEWEVGHPGLEQLDIVDSMHERKQRMYDLSDAFVAFPGGFGTLDELCEIATWVQLKYHNKPIIIYNQNGFFDALLAHFEKACTEGFLSPDHLAIIQEVKALDELKESLDRQLV